ncbi:MAG: hypothetical protein OXR67_02045 [Chloroflexota bacterium]|nr:hypothetical protein [Chloroflexota bacterium]
MKIWDDIDLGTAPALWHVGQVLEVQGLRMVDDQFQDEKGRKRDYQAVEAVVSGGEAVRFTKKDWTWLRHYQDNGQRFDLIILEVHNGRPKVIPVPKG